MLMCGAIRFRLSIVLASASVLAAQIPEAVHPGYALVNLRPEGFQPKGIGGMDFLADGTLAIATWGGYRRSEGEVFLVSGTGGPGPGGVQVRKIAQGLDEPMGLKVVNGEIHVLQRTELSRLAVPASPALATPVPVVGGWHPPAGDWTYGLIHKDGAFYATQGGWDPREPTLGKDQNSWLKLTPGQGYQSLAGGLRNADGIGLGPDGQMFATDNQGTWLPSSKLIHLVPGRFYGCRNNPNNAFANVPESPPAIWIPHGDIGFSPSQPILIPSGPYQGQMLAGDVHFGGIQRYFLEKVNGPAGTPEYQGAVFRFTGGLECGVNRLLFDQAGALYMGGVGGNSELGDLGGWNWNNKWTGLQKLVPNGKTAFDLLGVRSLADGFELEFTQPAADAGSAAKYSAEHWRYEPKADYGGPKVDKTPLAIASALAAPDGKRVRLRINGLRTGFIVHLKVSGVKSAEGEDLWAKDAWYTLNNLGPSEPAGLAVADPRHGIGYAAESFRIASAGPGGLRFTIADAGPFLLTLHDGAGHRLGEFAGAGAGSHLWTRQSGQSTLVAYRLSRPGRPDRTGRFAAF